MNDIVCETLLALSSCTAISMLCCAVVNCIDLWNIDFERASEAEQPSGWYRSGLFFYTNAALCFGCVFVMVLLY
jgi:hypothetical protein